MKLRTQLQILRDCSLQCRSWIFVWPIAGFVGLASTRRKKCNRPDSSPAIIVCPFGVAAQTVIPLSPVNVAIFWLLSRSQTRNVASVSGNRKPPVGGDLTADTGPEWPGQRGLELAGYQNPNAQGGIGGAGETADRPSGMPRP